jgi:hypothetical protein
MNTETRAASPVRHGRWLVLVAVAFVALACVRFASGRCARSDDAGE